MELDELQKKEKEKFMKLKQSDLIIAALEFGVDNVKDSDSKNSLADRLVEMGATVEVFQNVILPEMQQPDPQELDEEPENPRDDPEEESPEEEAPEDEELELIKMTRKNHSYEVRGYKFNQSHPYALVKESDAEFLIASGGFRPASRGEFKEFYAKS